MEDTIRLSRVLGHGRPRQWQWYIVHCAEHWPNMPTFVITAVAKCSHRDAKSIKLVPRSTVITLLKKQLRRFPGLLVALDWFPRNKQNYMDFNKILGPPEFAFVVNVPDDEMISRIMKRAGRRQSRNGTVAPQDVSWWDGVDVDQLALSNVLIYRSSGTNLRTGKVLCVAVVLLLSFYFDA